MNDIVIYVAPCDDPEMHKKLALLACMRHLALTGHTQQTGTILLIDGEPNISPTLRHEIQPTEYEFKLPPSLSNIMADDIPVVEPAPNTAISPYTSGKKHRKTRCYPHDTLRNINDARRHNSRHFFNRTTHKQRGKK